MVHPEVIKVKYPVESEEITEMFIGKFESDKEYHLLGYRSEKDKEKNSAVGIVFDLGVVNLPKNKNKLTDLIQDEIFFIKLEKDKPCPVKFISYSIN
jgi:hypothetical protein